MGIDCNCNSPSCAGRPSNNSVEKLYNKLDSRRCRAVRTKAHGLQNCTDSPKHSPSRLTWISRPGTADNTRPARSKPIRQPIPVTP